MIDKEILCDFICAIGAEIQEHEYDEHRDLIKLSIDNETMKPRLDLAIVIYDVHNNPAYINQFNGKPTRYLGYIVDIYINNDTYINNNTIFPEYYADEDWTETGYPDGYVYEINNKIWEVMSDSVTGILYGLIRGYMRKITYRYNLLTSKINEDILNMKRINSQNLETLNELE